MSLTARNELNIELKGLQGEAEGLKIPSTTNFKTITRYKSITDTSLRRWKTENILLAATIAANDNSKRKKKPGKNGEGSLIDRSGKMTQRRAYNIIC